MGSYCFLSLRKRWQLWMLRGMPRLWNQIGWKTPAANYRSICNCKWFYLNLALHEKTSRVIQLLVTNQLVTFERPYAFIFALIGCAHRSVMGQFSFFETNHEHVGGTMNHYRTTGANVNILVLLAGRLTPHTTAKRNCKKRSTWCRFISVRRLSRYVTYSNSQA